MTSLSQQSFFFKEPATILVVDDSPQDIALLSEYFRGSKLRLIVAFDGHEGYQKAIVVKPDLILMDVNMGRMDGFAACRLLKTDARTINIPVIFLSGCNEVDERLQGFFVGAVDFISKPFSPAEVLARISVHLKLSQPTTKQSDGSISNDESQSSEVAAKRSAVVQAAMDVLMQDIRKPPSLVELARLVGSNERTLTQLFRADTDMPVFAWLREQRITLACQLLGESELDIQQIADHVGYENAGNFTTMFRERIGMTPREYRQSMRDKMV